MKTIAVIFGGQSTEHEISIVTALTSVMKPLELTKKYNVVPVYIAKDGSWYSDKKLLNISFYQNKQLNIALEKLQRVQIKFTNGLELVKQKKYSGAIRQKIDIVFPAMHGTHGEDGDLMGLLEMAGVPYIGCGVASSAIAMDKVLCKLMVEAQGIATPKMQFITSADLNKNYDVFMSMVNKQLQYPLFVKPAHLGSSIGITKVNSPADLKSALEVAAHYDTKVLVEEGVQNLIEVTLPIIGNDNPVPAFLEQPQVATDEFFTFETKYMQGGKGGKKGGKAGGAQGYSIIPAPLDEKLYNKAEQLGLAVYKAIGCKGIARVDMLIDSKSGEVFFNEINPLPGGLYAHNWQKRGMSKIQLVEELVRFAEESFVQKQKAQTAFSTNYLQQF